MNQADKNKAELAEKFTEKQATCAHCDQTTPHEHVAVTQAEKDLILFTACLQGYESNLNRLLVVVEKKGEL